MLWFLLPVGFAAGVAVSAQFGVNTQLRGVVGGTVTAAAISFVVGTAALALAAALVDRRLPDAAAVVAAPPWVWVGGLLGAFYVLASIVLTPRLGAATTVGLVLAGQMVSSIAIDHFGLLRLEAQEAILPRLLGALLILVGVVLVQRF